MTARQLAASLRHGIEEQGTDGADGKCQETDYHRDQHPIPRRQQRPPSSCTQADRYFTFFFPHPSIAPADSGLSLAQVAK